MRAGDSDASEEDGHAGPWSAFDPVSPLSPSRAERHGFEY